MSYLDTIREKREVQAVKKEVQLVEIKNADYINAGEIRELLTELQAVRRDFNALRSALSKPSAEPEKLAPHLTALGDRLTKALTSQKASIVQAPEKTVSLGRVEELLTALIEQHQPKDVPTGNPALTDYSKCKACDLDNAPDGTQYIGFIDHVGNWYILHNDSKNNTERYHYGAGDYLAAWSDRYGLTYGLPGAKREV